MDRHIICTLTVLWVISHILWHYFLIWISKSWRTVGSVFLFIVKLTLLYWINNCRKPVLTYFMLTIWLTTSLAIWWYSLILGDKTIVCCINMLLFAFYWVKQILSRGCLLHEVMGLPIYFHQLDSLSYDPAWKPP